MSLNNISVSHSQWNSQSAKQPHTKIYFVHSKKQDNQLKPPVRKNSSTDPTITKIQSKKPTNKTTQLVCISNQPTISPSTTVQIGPKKTSSNSTTITAKIDNSNSPITNSSHISPVSWLLSPKAYRPSC